MDTTDPDISFDSNGYCNNCNSYILNNSDRKYQFNISESKWEEYTQQIKKTCKNRQYDCILGVSGGVDSSYAAILCKKYNLRTLLVHIDNGWNTEIATNNISKLAKKLNFDYVSYVIDWDEFREIQLAYLKALSVDLEMPTDIAIHAGIYKYASKYNIKYIISGGNIATEGMLPLAWGFHRYKDMRMYNYIVNKYSSVKIKNTPTIGIFLESYYRFFKKIKTLYILNYHDYDKDKVKNILIDNYDWVDYGGKHHESRITELWHGYVLPKVFGIDYRRPTLSAQILSNKINRNEALDILGKDPIELLNLNSKIRFVCNKFNISLDEFNIFISGTPKCYKNFPNNKAFIEYCYNLYRRYFNFSRL
jgi:N-acetyl sugar amidotransferase